MHLVSGFPAPDSLPSGHCWWDVPSEQGAACPLLTAWQDSPRAGAKGEEPQDAALLLSHPGLRQTEGNEIAAKFTSRVREEQLLTYTVQFFQKYQPPSFMNIFTLIVVSVFYREGKCFKGCE